MDRRKWILCTVGRDGNEVIMIGMWKAKIGGSRKEWQRSHVAVIYQDIAHILSS